MPAASYGLGSMKMRLRDCWLFYRRVSTNMSLQAKIAAKRMRNDGKDADDETTDMASTSSDAIASSAC